MEGARWGAAGHNVHVRPNLAELPDEEAEKAQRPKRMRSWDGDGEIDGRQREKLRELKRRCDYADAMPVRMFEFVLQAERRDIDRAETLIEWLYKPKAAELQDAWVREDGLEAKAKRVRE